MFQARIICGNGDVYVGELDSSSRHFHFEITANHDFDKCLEIRNINSDGDLVVAYIYSGDYMPRFFTVKQGSPLVINDYVSINNNPEERIKLEIIYG